MVRSTGARIGELLALRWEHCQDGYVTFWETKNGRASVSLSARRSTLY
jgi:integrase